MAKIGNLSLYEAYIKISEDNLLQWIKIIKRNSNTEKHKTDLLQLNRVYNFLLGHFFQNST